MHQRKFCISCDGKIPQKELSDILRVTHSWSWFVHKFLLTNFLPLSIAGGASALSRSLLPSDLSLHGWARLSVVEGCNGVQRATHVKFRRYHSPCKFVFFWHFSSVIHNLLSQYFKPNHSPERIGSLLYTNSNISSKMYRQHQRYLVGPREKAPAEIFSSSISYTPPHSSFIINVSLESFFAS